MSDPITVKIRRLPHGEGLPLPDYKSTLASGVDIYAALPKGSTVWLHPGDTKTIPTGFCVELPPGWELQCRSRSGLAANASLSVLNSPGTVDSDYRGEIFLILNNHGRESARLHRGDRIAQLVLAPVHRIQWQEVEELGETERGAGGLGSTGKGTE